MRPEQKAHSTSPNKRLHPTAHRIPTGGQAFSATNRPGNATGRPARRETAASFVNDCHQSASLACEHGSLYKCTEGRAQPCGKHLYMSGSTTTFPRIEDPRMVRGAQIVWIAGIALHWFIFLAALPCFWRGEAALTVYRLDDAHAPSIVNHIFGVGQILN
jgi:hypothetical protein